MTDRLKSVGLITSWPMLRKIVKENLPAEGKWYRIGTGIYRKQGVVIRMRNMWEVKELYLWGGYNPSKNYSRLFIETDMLIPKST